MKIDNETRFPYPVLSDVTGDYKFGHFHISAVVEERPANGKLKMDCTVSITEQTVQQQVVKKSAVMGVFVTCLDTYYNKLIELEDMKSSVEFAPGTLRGRVILRPLIWAIRDIQGYSSDNLHAEFGDGPWHFEKGSILAVGNEIVVNVGHEKLAPMESIFSLAINKEVAEGEIRVQSDNDKITIYCAQETYQTVAGLRGTRTGQSILLNSIRESD